MSFWCQFIDETTGQNLAVDGSANLGRTTRGFRVADFELVQLHHTVSWRLHTQDRVFLRAGDGRFATTDAEVESGLLTFRWPSERFRPAVLVVHDPAPSHTVTPGDVITLERERAIAPDNFWRDFAAVVAGILTGGATPGIGTFMAGAYAAGIVHSLTDEDRGRVVRDFLWFDPSGNARAEPIRAAITPISMRAYPIQLRCHLRAIDGSFVMVRNAVERLESSSPNRGPWEELHLMVRPRDPDRAWDGQLRSGDNVWIQGPEGSFVTVDDDERGVLKADHRGTDPTEFTVLRVGEHGPIRHGDRLRLLAHGSVDVRRDTDPRRLLRADRRLGLGATDENTFTLELRRPLNLFRNGAATRTLASWTGRGAARSAGFTEGASQGEVWIGPRHNTVPLRAFTNPATADVAVVSSTAGTGELRGAGYSFTQLEGHVLEAGEHRTTPLKHYRAGGDTAFRGPDTAMLTGPLATDSLTAALRDDERVAGRAGYRFVRIEGYLHQGPAVLAPIRPVLAPRPTDPTDPTDTRDGPPRPTDDMRRGGRALGGLTRGVLDAGRRVFDRVDPAALRGRGQRRLKHAWVLGGGGAKGCFQAGAVQYLAESEGMPDLICGTSVGSVNGAKLAEGPAAVEELIALWKGLGSDHRAIDESYYFDRILDWAEGNLVDGLLEVAGRGFALVPTMGASALGFSVGDTVRPFLQMLSQLHAINSMAPLRRVIERGVRTDLLKASRIVLRMSVVDATSGRLFTVSGPEPWWPDDLVDYGRVEPELDAQLGGDWLSQPLFGSDAYLMRIADAVYASSTIPGIMDTKMTRLDDALFRETRDSVFTLLNFVLPEPVERLLARRQEYVDPRRDYGPDTSSHYFYDGGLRDTLPIRTAMRLGARKITVVSCDRLQTTRATPPNPNELSGTPLIAHVFRLLGIWNNDVSRNDLLGAVGANEMLGWLHKAYAALDETARASLLSEMRTYWSARGERLLAHAGAATALGGRTGWTPATTSNSSAYGAPPFDEGCEIRFISPDREILDALAFHDTRGIRDGLDLGYQVAQAPVVLSHPVAEALIGSDG